MASLNEHYRAARPSCDRSSEISVVLGKRIQGCATSNARFEPENYTGSHDGFNSVRAAANARQKASFLSREVPDTPMPHRHKLGRVLINRDCSAIAGCPKRRVRVAPRGETQAIFFRRRHQARRPPPANIRPGRSAPTMGPGTTDAENVD